MTKPTSTPRVDAIVPSESFVRETRLFDMSYYLPLLSLARDLERALAASQERAEEAERKLSQFVELARMQGIQVTMFECGGDRHDK